MGIYFLTQHPSEHRPTFGAARWAPGGTTPPGGRCALLSSGGPSGGSCSPCWPPGRSTPIPEPSTKVRTGHSNFSDSQGINLRRQITFPFDSLRAHGVSTVLAPPSRMFLRAPLLLRLPAAPPHTPGTQAPLVQLSSRPVSRDKRVVSRSTQTGLRPSLCLSRGLPGQRGDGSQAGALQPQVSEHQTPATVPNVSPGRFVFLKTLKLHVWRQNTNEKR